MEMIRVNEDPLSARANNTNGIGNATQLTFVDCSYIELFILPHGSMISFFKSCDNTGTEYIFSIDMH